MEKALSLDRAYRDTPFYERFALAAAAGFDHIEFGAWSDLDLTRVAEEMKRHNLRLLSLCGSDGHNLANHETHSKFMEHLSQSMAVGKLFGCTQIIIETHIGASGAPSPAAAADTSVIARDDLKNAAIATRVLMAVAQKAERTGITLYLKPPNDIAGNYGFLSVMRLSGNVVGAVNSPALRLLLDSTYLWKFRSDPDAANVMRRIQPFVGYIHMGEYSTKNEWPEETAWFKKNLLSFYQFNGNMGLLYPAATDDTEILSGFLNL